MISFDEVYGDIYDPGISFDNVYLIKYGSNPIGVLYLSDMKNEKEIYIEWIEFFSTCRYKGLLRQCFEELSEDYDVIHLECSKELLGKYVYIGCINVGYDEDREMYELEYIKRRNSYETCRIC